MKNLLTIIILIAILYLLYNIKVEHISNLPHDKIQHILQKRQQKNITSNIIHDDTDINLSDNFLQHIKNNYIDPDYTFNLSNLPVSIRSPKQSRSTDYLVLQHIKNDIQTWDKTLHILSIEPLMIKSTNYDEIFYIKVFLSINNIKHNYNLKYYIIHHENDNINDDDIDFTLQLIDISDNFISDKVYKSYIPTLTGLADYENTVDNINRQHFTTRNNKSIIKYSFI